ncbi:unnamed protein product [Clonostachys byssicola]|uniref:Uncharacterized protein n=1 Tax=Clonostachys byssicola TaxID=160290 RepID=A0A9N9U772_9HYPO|nr:unnamed protein product [Clonostachys byssicola]
MLETLERSKFFVPQFESVLKLPKVTRLDFKHDSTPCSPTGITFGSNERCGVILPRHKMISQYHFSLTFDRMDRLIIIDHSTNGTEVKYGDQGTGLCKQRQWILNDPKLPGKLRDIEINIAGVLSFKVDCLMMPSEPSYTDVVVGFRRLCQAKDNIDNELEGLCMDQTSAMLKPKVEDVWLHWPVGKGTSASITWCWNTADGSDKAVKKPLAGKYNEVRWLQEARFLESLKKNHHVVNFLDSTDDPSIEIEYLGGGSLNEPKYPSPGSQDPYQFSQEEARSILAQCLSALKEMHAQSPAICHRDIKPANILINQRTLSGICVKLADFGEAKTECDEDTWGINPVYVAPEFWDRKNCHPTMDIWSLGLTVLALIDEDLQKLYNTGDCAFWTRMDQSKDRLVQFLRLTMLREPPDERASAEECLERLRAEGDIKACGCKCRPCDQNVFESENEDAERPTTPNVQEDFSDCTTPRPSKLADGQSEDSSTTPTPTRTPTPAPTPAHSQATHVSPPEGSATDMLPTTPNVGGSPTTSLWGSSPVNAGEQVAAPASPADSPTSEEAVALTDEAHRPVKGKRRTESDDEVLGCKRPKV